MTAHPDIWTASTTIIAWSVIVPLITGMIVVVLYATSCLIRSRWPWETWLALRAQDRIDVRRHREAMEKIVMGTLNEPAR